MPLTHPARPRERGPQTNLGGAPSQFLIITIGSNGVILVALSGDTCTVRLNGKRRVVSAEGSDLGALCRFINVTANVIPVVGWQLTLM